jgi:hypothetical protein
LTALQKPHSITTDAKAIGAALISQAASAAVQQGKEVLLAGVTLHAKQLVQEEVGVDVSGLESEREAQLAELEEQLVRGGGGGGQGWLKSCVGASSFFTQARGKLAAAWSHHVMCRPTVALAVTQP